MAARNLTPAAKIAATARAEIKAAQKAGKLALPDGAKIRVCSHNFSMGCSVDIRVEDVDKTWALTVENDGYGHDVARHTAAAKKAGAVLGKILAASTDGHTWGDVILCGVTVNGGSITPASWRPGQD